MRWENEWNRKRKSGRYKMRDARRPYLRLTRAGSLRWAYTYNTHIYDRFASWGGAEEEGAFSCRQSPRKQIKRFFFNFRKPRVRRTYSHFLCFAACCVRFSLTPRTRSLFVCGGRRGKKYRARAVTMLPMGVDNYENFMDRKSATRGASVLFRLAGDGSAVSLRHSARSWCMKNSWKCGLAKLVGN